VKHIVIDLFGHKMEGNPSPLLNETPSEFLGGAVVQAMRYLTSTHPDGDYAWGHFYGFNFPSLQVLPC